MVKIQKILFLELLPKIRKRKAKRLKNQQKVIKKKNKKGKKSNVINGASNARENESNLHNFDEKNDIEVSKSLNNFENAKYWSIINDYSNYTSYLKLDQINFPICDNRQQKFEGLDPYQIFQFFFTEELFEHIYNSTNYYRMKLHKDGLCRSYEVTNHEKKRDSRRIGEVEINEVKVYFGILLFMSFNRHSFYIGIIHLKLKNTGIQKMNCLTLL